MTQSWYDIGVTIYILSYQHNEHGNVLSYHSSKRSAMTTFATDRRMAKSEGYFASDPYVGKYKVPATRKGFLAFLNHHTPAHDNG